MNFKFYRAKGRLLSSGSLFTRTWLKRVSFGAIVSTSLLAFVGCSPDITPADYTKLPEFGSSTVSLYVEKCGDCHAAPMPSVHRKALWPATVHRMQMRMTSKKVVPLNPQQEKLVVDYLVKYAPN